MTSIEIFKPDNKFCTELAGDMRRKDKEEIEATSGRTPFEALVHACSVSGTTCWGARIAGRPAGMWGARPTNLLASVAIPWALTGTVVEEYPILFFRTSKDMLTILHMKYEVLVQAVDARYEEALRWVARLGFSISQYPMAFGIQHRMFYMIRSERKRHV